MLAEHDHLFFGEEALEILPRVCRTGYDLRIRAYPRHAINSAREQSEHQIGLRGQLDVDNATAKTSGASVLSASFEPVDELNGCVEAGELTVRILRLASDTVHDDVDGLVAVVEDLRRLAQEGDDLTARSLIRDLILQGE